MNGIELINASAGSGKTYRLTTLVVEKLRDGVAPEGLMATTFTNKAAAELRERIRLQLLKDGKSIEAQRVFDGFVGTVNSICSRLLCEYALDAGLSPALDVLPEDDSKRLFQVAIASVINAHADTLEPAARRAGRDGGGSGYAKRDDWRDDVQKVVELARANQLSGSDLRECARRSWEALSALFGPPGAADTSGLLDAEVAVAIKGLLLIAEPKKKTAETLERLKTFQRKRSQGDIPWSEWAWLAKAGTNKDGEGLLDEVHRIAGDVLNNPQFQEDERALIFGVFECAAQALEAYETYKRNQGLMDFVDQETQVLALARDNAAFRASMGERLQQLMVDEFQDTSPIQLALFLELNDLAGQSVWVGDPKQSIYGFRGADPQLMEEVTKRLSDTQTLDESWRSREVLVAFSNAVFSEVFRGMGSDKVRLKIPAARKAEARGGWLESWNLCAGNKDNAAAALANGVKDLLERTGLNPGDIAVLCYTHKEQAAVAQRLRELGIKSSAGQGLLTETRECRLALGALRYMRDPRDTVALAEIVHLSPGHADHGQWLQSLMKEKAGAVTQWVNDPLIAALDEARAALIHATPLEALELAIDRVDIMNTVKSWTNTAMRVSNLDALRGACCEYLDQCRARRAAATVAGFINYLREAEPTQARGADEQTVQVHTYHGAKGLEWPVVVLSSLDKEFKQGAFGISVAPAPVFDPGNPLANRSISFWPWPFGAQKSLPALDHELAERPEEIQARERAKREARRLLYVGMTRARDGMVFAIRKKVNKTSAKLLTGWLDELTDEAGEALLTWPLETGDLELKVGAADIPIRVTEFSAEAPDGVAQAPEPTAYLSPPVDLAHPHPPARRRASELAVDEDARSDVKVQLVANLGKRLEIKGQPDMALLGNSVHGFLGADIPGLSAERRLEIATGLLRRWGVEHAMNPAALLTAGDRLSEFVEKTYPGAKALREWPVTLYNAERQLMHGWVDMLLELPDGYVVIDHKSYPGTDPEDHAKQYAPQLAAYKEAVEKATGKNVLATLVHMPVVGSIFAVDVLEG